MRGWNQRLEKRSRTRSHDMSLSLHLWLWHHTHYNVGCSRFQLSRLSKYSTWTPTKPSRRNITDGAKVVVARVVTWSAPRLLIAHILILRWPILALEWAILKYFGFGSGHGVFLTILENILQGYWASVWVYFGGSHYLFGILGYL